VSEGAAAKLEIVDDVDPHARPIALLPGKRILIGREADCDLCIDHPAVSRHHAAISVVGGSASVEDLGSRHGTRVNGRALAAQTIAEMREGDVIHIGPHALRVRLSGSDADGEIKIDGTATMAAFSARSRGMPLEIVNDSRPESAPIALRPGLRLIVGRLADCDIFVDDPAVSRQHAAIAVTAMGATVEDLGSRHGTRVNGQFVRSGRPVELSEGDVLQVGPRILRVRAATTRIRAEAGTESPNSVRTIAVGAQGGAEHALRVLIDVVRSIPSDGTTEAAGRMVLEKLLSVTKLERALLVRFDPMRADADIIAGAGPEDRPISRTVLASASDPLRVAHLSQSTMNIQSAASIAGTGVREVLCARVVVEGDDQLYLYLDSAGARAPVDAAMAEFVGAAARICGLVIESFARRRLEALRLDVERARLVQRRLLSDASGSLEGYSWHLESLPGLMLAGDFAGIARRPDGSVLAWVGDVSGKGAAAAMLMASAQSWMFAAATRVEALGVTVQALSQFLYEKSEPSEFATMFVMVLDPAGLVTICDAGHGIAFVVEDGSVTRIEAEGGVPVGATPDGEYATSSITLARGSRIVVATDGAFEQRSATGEMFGLERLGTTLGGSSGTNDDVAHVFEGLRAHAGESFDDDVTVLSVVRR
jgi:phosphoserine phosphatase RsbU/P